MSGNEERRQTINSSIFETPGVTISVDEPKMREREVGGEGGGGYEGKKYHPHTKAVMCYSDDSIMAFNSAQFNILHVDGKMLV